LEQAAEGSEEARVLAWQVFLAERQLRQAVGYDHPAGGDWSAAAEQANALVGAVDQLEAALYRDYGGAPEARELLFDVHTSRREGAGVADLVARRASAEQLNEQHGYFVMAFRRVEDRLRGWGPQHEDPYRPVMRQVGRADRRLCDAVGIQAAVMGDVIQTQADNAWRLSAAADRLRRVLRTVLGNADAESTAYYLDPADQLAYQSEQLHVALAEGRDPYVTRGGFAVIEQVAPTAIRRVESLDRGQVDLAYRLARECADVLGEMRPVFGR
jgi:hypothetical protein